MSVQERIAELNNLEQESDVYRERLWGVPLWRLVRLGELDSLLRKQGTIDKRRYSPPPLRRIGNALIFSAISICQLLRIRRKRYLFIGFPRRTETSGGFIDPLTDPLIDELGRENCLCLEKPFMAVHRRPGYAGGPIYYDAPYYAAYAMTLIFGWVFIPFAAKPANRLFNQVQSNLTQKTKSRFVLLTCLRFAQFCFERQLARFFLWVVTPTHLILVNRWNNMPFIHAAYRAGITVAELQHGAIQGKTVPYSSEYCPTIDPDLFFAFGEFWIDEEWGLPTSQIVVTGHKYLENSAETMRDTVARQPSTILVASQPERRDFRTLLPDLMTRYPDVLFRLKLHPQEVYNWESRYGHLLDAHGQVEVIDQDVDLYQLIAESEVILGISSTVLYEASFLGAKVAIINFDGSNLCPALQFAGKYGFYELKSPDGLARVLAAPARSVGPHGTPFFSAFNRKSVFSVLGQPL